MLKTRYPIFLVHGVGFRDRRHLCYWGRIPKILEEGGATIAYGGQDSWGETAHNAEILKKSLLEYISKTGCEKVNIIAHSKGGVEARYLAAALGGAPHIASITTISSPHHGSKIMDTLLKFPNWMFCATAFFINLWFRLLGDKNPDFHAACHQLTSTYMTDFNNKYPDVAGIYYQSYASAMKNSFSDIFMCLPHFFVNLTDGESDGLVSVSSAAWTNFKGVWRGTTSRGISHADSVDMRRRRFTKKPSAGNVSDICSCYAELVRELKLSGF